MTVRRGVVLLVLALSLGILLLGRYSTLPSLENRTASTALVDTGTTRLGSAIAPLVTTHRGVSGM